MNQNHHNITPPTWQQTQDVTPQTTLGYKVSAEFQGSPSVLCLLVDLARVILFTVQPKAKPSLQHSLFLSTGVTTATELC